MLAFVTLNGLHVVVVIIIVLYKYERYYSSSFELALEMDRHGRIDFVV
jgi:hypothetical protein